MNKILLIASTCLLGTMIAVLSIAKWWAAHENVGIPGNMPVIPSIRYERYDAERSRLLVALSNPGLVPVEVTSTSLSDQPILKPTGFPAQTKEYGNKPLVLDPGDTVLIPFQVTGGAIMKKPKRDYWGKIDFRIPGETDRYTLCHHFTNIDRDATQHGSQNRRSK